MQELFAEKIHILEKLNLSDSCTPTHLYLLVLDEAFRKKPQLIDQYAKILHEDFGIKKHEVTAYMVREFSHILGRRYIQRHINNDYKNTKQRFNCIRGLLKANSDHAATIRETMEIMD